MESSPAGWLPQSVPRSRCGKLACKRMGQRRRRYSPASWSPTECATKPLWEACLQANGTTPEVGIRQQAGLPQSVPRSHCGKLACKRMGQRQRPVFASKLVSHRVCHEAAVGSLLASEWGIVGGCIRQQGWLPQIELRSRCGKLACKRMGQRQRPVFASKLVSHRVCHEAAVGSLLASERDNAGGRNSPASWSPTECATKPLWEACLQANGTTPEVGIRQQAGLPQSVPRSHCGKLACKRMRQRRRPYSPASWSPTECATKPLWEACLQANGATPEAVFASKLVSHRVCHGAAVGSLLASEWANAGGRIRQQAGSHSLSG
jgi:alkylated DNA repair dioxygenase AlkB